VAIPDPLEGSNHDSDYSDDSEAFVLLPFESVKSSFDGRGAERPWLQVLPDPLSTVMWGSWVEVAAADARRLHLEAGDMVRVYNDQGSVEVTAVVNPSARPGTLAMPLGMGHETGSRYSTGVGVNVHSLLAGDVVIGTEVPTLADTVVSLEKVAGRKRGQGAVIYGRGLHETEQIPAGWAPHEPLESNGVHGADAGVANGVASDTSSKTGETKR
jgi:molybdopterin-containing oxidoreductase family iron-sulfur binding subunit